MGVRGAELDSVVDEALTQVGRELQIQYFDDVYPVTVAAVGYSALYDPENTKPRS
jgi:hypothetical protein